jgi:hypothetical protein
MNAFILVTEPDRLLLMAGHVKHAVREYRQPSAADTQQAQTPGQTKIQRAHT